MKTKQATLKIRHLLKVISVLCIVMFFCPTFLVSCSDTSQNVNVMTVVGGAEAYGEKVSEGHPVFLICLLIPIVILVLFCIKNMAEKKCSAIILCLAIADFIVWLIMESGVKEFAEENMCEFKATAWFYINMILLVLLALLSILSITNIISIDNAVGDMFSGVDSQKALNQMSATMSQMTSAVSQLAENVSSTISGKMSKEDVMGYCSKCGTPLIFGNAFCTSCGNPIPADIIAAAEEKKKAEEAEAAKKAAEEAEAGRKMAEDEKNDNDKTSASQPAYCIKCGARLSSDSVFCESCGYKVK